MEFMLGADVVLQALGRCAGLQVAHMLLPPILQRRHRPLYRPSLLCAPSIWNNAGPIKSVLYICRRSLASQEGDLCMQRALRLRFQECHGISSSP